MNRFLLGIALVGAAAVLGGCPIYSGTQETQVCDGNACYSCPNPSYSSACTPWPCQGNLDCPYGYSCDPNTYACDTSGAPPDGGPIGSDCSVTGCPTGQVCKLSNGTAQCTSLGGGDDGSVSPGEGGSEGGSDGGIDATDGGGGDGEAGVATDSGGDASDGGNTGPCLIDSDCTSSGARCIDGQCRPQVQLCSDRTQCNAKGSSCVDGVCEPVCSASSSCPTGYQCDLTRGVCNVNPAPCTGSGTSSCLGGTTCVDAHCVPPCAASDSGPTCPAGSVCVSGGCLPDQAASFACANDGQSGQLATTCAASEICIHHDCYPACGADGGGTCSGSHVCKSVTIETGTYSVCGTTTTLGSDCDPSQGKYCSGGKVCVDGYCL